MTDPQSSLIRVYISGPITRSASAEIDFAEAESRLKNLGYNPVNPLHIEPPPSGVHSWSYYMRKAIALLVECQYIYMIPGWEYSDGAKIERELAKKINIKEVEIT